MLYSLPENNKKQKENRLQLHTPNTADTSKVISNYFSTLSIPFK